MAQIKQQVGARTALGAGALGSLAAATYTVSSSYVANTNQPLDVVVEVIATASATPTGNKQLMVFIQESLDGTSFRSGPTSGTDATNEGNLRPLGPMPMNSTSQQVGMFSIAQALGYVPHTFRIVIKNDMGVAVSAGTMFTAEINSTSV